VILTAGIAKAVDTVLYKVVDTVIIELVMSLEILVLNSSDKWDNWSITPDAKVDTFNKLFSLIYVLIARTVANPRIFFASVNCA
jgi:hypothetical protein